MPSILLQQETPGGHYARTDALEQLDHIHKQLTRSEVYRGFRVPAVAVVGLAAFAAAAARPLVLSTVTASGFVVYWVAVAAGCA